MARTINLTDRDIDYISRVVDTEVPRSIQRRSPETYDAMVKAVVDTVTNRMASSAYPKTVTGVLNQRRAFSQITGPKRMGPFGSVQNTPKALQATQDLVREHVENRVSGGLSTIGNSVNYANPNFSSKKNLRSWINPMIEAGAQRLGIGQDVHYHGNAPGATPADEYSVALNGVDNSGPLSRIPTPTFADRAGTGINQADSATGIMSAINPATPISVERGLLGDPSISASAVGQSGAGSIAAASGTTPRLSYRASPEEMNSMQQEANRARQALEMSHGSLSLNPSQLSDAMTRRDTAMGLLSADRNPVAAIEAISPTQTRPQTDLAKAYGLLGSSMQQGGILGLSGDKIMDPNDLLGVGRLQTPSVLPVETMPATDMTASIDDMPTVETIEGPATAQAIRTPQRSTSYMGGGLLSPSETDMVRDQQIALSNAGKNKSVALKNALGAMGGSIAGGLLAGPLGALLGGYVGNKFATGPRGSGLNYYPERPTGGSRGDGKMTDYGRSVRESSGQFKSATDKKSVGLY